MKRLVAACLLTATACTTATIYRHDAPDLEAVIVAGNAADLYVETEDGRYVRVSRRNVTDIDHPGNLEALIGGVLLAEGAAMAGVALASREADMRGTFGTVGAIVGVPGLLLLAHGLLTWSRSTAAAADLDSHFPLRYPPAPVALALAPTPVALPLPVTPP